MSTKSERVLPLILDARRALRGGAAAIAERQRAGFAEMVAFARAKSSRWAQRPNMASHQRDELAANERSTRDDDMSDSDRSYWDKHSKNYDRSMSLLGRPIPRMVELAHEATRGMGRVLEVAAGTGLVTPALASGAAEVIATDYSAAMVAALERRVRDAGVTNVRCEQADLYALRFDDGTFDAVVAANVLHLVPDLPGALAALRRVVKPGGRVIVPTFCHDETPFSWVVSRALAVTGFPGHRRFTAKSLRQAVEEAGVRVCRASELLTP